jgi:hypothetical protein
LVALMFPDCRVALRAASAGGMPGATFSSVRIAMWNRISSAISSRTFSLRTMAETLVRASARQLS